jgi:hypothetical protein
VVYEEPGQIHMAPFRRRMQRSRPTLVLCSCIGTVVDEEPGEIDITR